MVWANEVINFIWRSNGARSSLSKGLKAQLLTHPYSSVVIFLALLEVTRLRFIDLLKKLFISY